MTIDATFADINITPDAFEWRQRFDSRNARNIAANREHRDNLKETCDHDRDRDEAERLRRRELEKQLLDLASSDEEERRRRDAGR